MEDETGKKGFNEDSLPDDTQAMSAVQITCLSSCRVGWFASVVLSVKRVISPLSPMCLRAYMRVWSIAVRFISSVTAHWSLDQTKPNQRPPSSTQPPGTCFRSRRHFVRPSLRLAAAAEYGFIGIGT
jgi:hypothetical protein